MNNNAVLDLSTDTYTYDTMYALFEHWYVEAIDGYFKHKYCISYYNRWGKLLLYTQIPLNGLTLLVIGIQIILEQSLPTMNFIYFSIVILVLQFILFVLSLANSMNWQATAFEHQSASDSYKKISEDIIRLLTPLSRSELDINLTDARARIQERLHDLQSANLIVPPGISKKFDLTKMRKGGEYSKLMKLYATISSNNNELFAPLYNHVVAENIQFNDEINAQYNDDSSSEIPSLQQEYEHLQN